VSEPALVFPGYKLLRPLGKGGMGEVFLAEDEALGRMVAIKTLTPSPEGRARFMREARSLATLDHQRVVKIYSFGQTGECPFFVMEYVDGETISQRLAREGRLPLAEVVRVTRQIVEALRAAHRRGIVHRDIKPSNILVDAEGQIRVADFGLARPAENAVSLTSAGSFAGSPHYVSPEQARGEDVDFRGDLYSLGIVIYEMLTGHKPFEGASVAVVVSRQLNDPVPSVRALRSETPEWLDSLIQRLTRKDPAERPDSHDEVLQALDHEATIPEDADNTMTRTRGGAASPSAGVAKSKSRLSRAAMVALLLIAIVALSLGAWKYSNRRPAGALVVVVAPFASEDPGSVNEGRTLAALVQDEIERKSPETSIFVVGPEASSRTPSTESGARKLLSLETASFVVWGRVFKVDDRTEIEARLTTAPGGALPPAWPTGISVDNSKEGLEVRRRFAQDIAAAVSGLREGLSR
jgi:serine/threonine protein kinase